MPNKFANAKIAVSGIIVQHDILVNDKIEEVNEGIKELCIKRKYIKNIELNALNLNTGGSAFLASGLKTERFENCKFERK